MHVISRRRGLGLHSREHLRLGPKLAPRFFGRQQPAARRNPNPAASLPPISESPQRRKACIKLGARLQKMRRLARVPFRKLSAPSELPRRLKIALRQRQELSRRL